MWEPQHWYTAFSRAEYLSNVFIVDVPPPTPAPPHTEAYAHTFIYNITSPTQPSVYIGHGSTPKKSDDKDTSASLQTSAARGAAPASKSSNTAAPRSTHRSIPLRLFGGGESARAPLD